jgi:hypothetical protein
MFNGKKKLFVYCIFKKFYQYELFAFVVAFVY